MYNNQENNYSNDNTLLNKVSLKVVGIGGCGNNSIKTLLENKKGIETEYIVINTDLQCLMENPCENKILLDKETKGWGAGNDPKVGAQAAIDKTEEIRQKLSGADVVVIAAGLGGGTGTGAAPVVANIARELGALTISVVTTPFEHEGKKAKQIAEEGLKELVKNTDSYIVISNNKLEENFSEMPMKELFKLANVNLKNFIEILNDIIYRVGDINIDFADLKNVLKDSGLTVVGVAKSSGDDRAIKAVKKAFEQSLYDFEIKSAEKVIVNVQYDQKTTSKEIKQTYAEIEKYFNEIDSSSYEIISGQEEIKGSNEKDFYKVSIIATAIKTKDNFSELKNDEKYVFNDSQESHWEKEVIEDSKQELDNDIFSEEAFEEEHNKEKFGMDNTQEKDFTSWVDSNNETDDFDLHDEEYFQTDDIYGETKQINISDLDSEENTTEKESFSFGKKWFSKS